MFTKATQAIALLISLFLMPAAFAAPLSDKMAGLVSKYQALPSYPDEDLIASLANNILIAPLLQSAPKEIEAELEKLNLKSVEKNLLLKQYYLGEIYKQAVRDIDDPSRLLAVFLGNEALDTDQAFILPSIEELSDIKSFYEIIHLLVQTKKPAAEVVALELLQLEGIRYPSTDSFARGLANYAAISAANADRFDEILKLFDDLYVIRDAQNRLLEERRKATGQYRSPYYIGNIASELTDASYNESYGDPKQRAKIIKNLLAQIELRNRRHFADQYAVRSDLLSALATIPEHETWLYAKNILETSESVSDLTAVLFGIGSERSIEVYNVVYELVNRLQHFAENPELKTVMGQAVGVFISPFISDDSDEEIQVARAGLQGYLPSLFSHPNSIVRQRSISVLQSKDFDFSMVREVLLKLLADPDEWVRSSAMGHIGLWVRTENAVQFMDALQLIAQSDPVERRRVQAAEVIERINSRIQRMAALKPKSCAADLTSN